MWQEIREGRREHPARIWRRTDPRRYGLWMKYTREARNPRTRLTA